MWGPDMNIDASVGKAPKHIGLHERCGKLVLKATNDDEARLLSCMYRAIVGGGRVGAGMPGEAMLVTSFGEVDPVAAALVDLGGTEDEP